MEKNNESIFLLKNLLHICNIDELKDIYLLDELKYFYFINDLNMLLEEDPYSIFILNRARNKILNMITLYRGSEIRNKVLDNLSNKAIIKYNTIKKVENSPELEKYKEFQKSRRLITDNLLLPSLIAFDYCLIDGLKNNRLDQLDPETVLSSSVYLLHTYPEIYQNNKNYVDRTVEYLKKNKRGKGVLYRLNTKILTKALKKEYQ